MLMYVHNKPKHKMVRLSVVEIAFIQYAFDVYG